jgi:hypothetical protein
MSAGRRGRRHAWSPDSGRKDGRGRGRAIGLPVNGPPVNGLPINGLPVSGAEDAEHCSAADGRQA